MRRLRNRTRGQTSYYHLISRTVDGEKLLGDPEKEFFLELIAQVADFSGIQVIAYSVMSDHTHVLVEVPPIEGEYSDSEIVARYQKLYPEPTNALPYTVEELAELLEENQSEGQAIRAHLSRRMGDPSYFMKSVKQRFTSWFNQKYDRYGPVWGDRFTSVLVEGKSWPLQVVAAYIDLNSVRMGLVEDPGQYLYAGYAQAKNGNPEAQAGYRALGVDFDVYEKLLASSKETDEVLKDRERMALVLTEGNAEVSIQTALRFKIRYFNEGKVLGSPDFVENHAKAFARNPKRERKAHPMHGADWKGLTVGTGLRMNLFR